VNHQNQNIQHSLAQEEWMVNSNVGLYANIAANNHWMAFDGKNNLVSGAGGRSH
jgi:hypothetical protein